MGRRGGRGDAPEERCWGQSMRRQVRGGLGGMNVVTNLDGSIDFGNNDTEE